MIKLDLGGAVQNNADDKEYLTVDINPSADIVMDFEDPNLKFPFGESSVDEIRAFHILEHIRNLFPLMDECHRILKPNGRMYIVVPKFPEGTATVDPTHVRFMVPENFHYFSRKFAYMGYTKKFWFMNLAEAIKLNTLIRDVYFRIEFIPDKYEQETIKSCLTVLHDAVVEDKFSGPNWEDGHKINSYEKVVRALSTLHLYSSGMPITRYLKDGVECGPLANAKMPWRKFGYYQDQIEHIKKVYDPPVVKVQKDAVEEITEVKNEVRQIEANDNIDRCVACGSEAVLVNVSTLEEKFKNKILLVYPEATNGYVCPGCLGEEYVDSIEA